MRQIHPKAITIVILILIVAGVCGLFLYRKSQTSFRIADHRMGESLSDFAEIEAKRYRINLSDCEHIGYPGKRSLCDYLVKLRTSKSVPQAFQYSSGGWFDDNFPIKENESRLTSQGMPDIAENWDVTFHHGRLFEVNFYPPGDYVDWMRSTLGPPSQSEHPPTKEDRVHGTFIGQVDREFIWNLEALGRGHAIVHLTQAVSSNVVRWSRMAIVFSGGNNPTFSTSVSPSNTGTSSSEEAAPLGRFSKHTWEIIKFGDGYAALRYLHPATSAVFKQDEHLFFANADGGTFSPGKPQDGILIFDFCRAHFCTEEESILFIDANTGSAAGIIIHEGVAHPYPGDYGTQDKWPQPLKDWWTKNTGAQ